MDWVGEPLKGECSHPAAELWAPRRQAGNANDLHAVRMYLMGEAPLRMACCARVEASLDLRLRVDSASDRREAHMFPLSGMLLLKRAYYAMAGPLLALRHQADNASDRREAHTFPLAGVVLSKSLVSRPEEG